MALDKDALSDLLDALRAGGDLDVLSEPACSWCSRP